MNSATIVNLDPSHFDALVALQYDCFANIPEAEYDQHEHFAHRYNIFPEGTFVALIDGKVVGMASGLFIDFEFDPPFCRTVDGFRGDGFYSAHCPEGSYYYADDIAVHSDYRRRGIGRSFYEARKSLVQRLGKKGIIAGGLPVGYLRYRDRLSIHEYVALVKAKKCYDSTLSFQMNNGFQIIDMIEKFTPNDGHDWGVLIYWENPTTSV
jgi:GNAT superfamily N-acetyltransferase